MSEFLQNTAAQHDPQIETVSHFWVASYPFFETTLLVLPPLSLVGSELPLSSIKVFDPDGALINEVSFSFPADQIGILEVDPLLGACKIESGLKHARLVISSPFKTRHYCRIQTQDRSGLLGEPLPFCNEDGAFFPLTFSSERSSLLCLINNSAEVSRIRCRVLSNKRSPEVMLTVPARGARALVIESLFPEIARIEESKRRLAYLRVSTKEDQRVAAQVLERTRCGENRFVYSSVS